jgi:hypothetical protein
LWGWTIDGLTVINSDISKDGEQHVHHNLLKDRIPETIPYDLALRINKDGNMLQLRSVIKYSGCVLHAGPLILIIV